MTLSAEEHYDKIHEVIELAMDLKISCPGYPYDEPEWQEICKKVEFIVSEFDW